MKEVEKRLGVRNPPLTASTSSSSSSQNLLSEVAKENESLDKSTDEVALILQPPKKNGKRKMSGSLTSSVESHMKARTNMMETLSSFLTPRNKTSKENPYDLTGDEKKPTVTPNIPGRPYAALSLEEVQQKIVE